MPKMPKTLAAALLLVSGTSALALPFRTSDSFVHEKTGYEVKVRDTGMKMYIKGFNPRTGETFDVAVSRSRKVTGTFAGKPVSYVMGDTSPAQLATAHQALDAAQ